MPRGVYKRTKSLKGKVGVYKHKKGYKRKPFTKEWKDNISKGLLGNTHCKGKHWKVKDKSKMFGHKAWNKGTHGLMNPWNKGVKIGKNTKASKTKTGKPILANQGDKHWNWRGGTTEGRRKDKKHVAWARNVKKKDNYKCLLEDENCKGQLVAHHILPYQIYPKERYNIKNGITLCRHHHPRKREDEIRLIPTFQKLVEVI